MDAFHESLSSWLQWSFQTKNKQRGKVSLFYLLKRANVMVSVIDFNPLLFLYVWWSEANATLILFKSTPVVFCWYNVMCWTWDWGLLYVPGRSSMLRGGFFFIESYSEYRILYSSYTWSAWEQLDLRELGERYKKDETADRIWLRTE